jgi:hypothetical protein
MYLPHRTDGWVLGGKTDEQEGQSGPSSGSCKTTHSCRELIIGPPIYGPGSSHSVAVVGSKAGLPGPRSRIQCIFKFVNPTAVIVSTTGPIICRIFFNSTYNPSRSETLLLPSNTAAA